ncbi:MAG: hypothetical protein QOJ16_773 [Acidobacteriota bacterium]|jgi:hypothetical protein|nr:hypothetical protein [Acidobacteriota bacterium]
MERMKAAHFTVAADIEQSARWKQAAEVAGHLSIGTWLAEAADVHAQPRPRAAPAVPPSLVAPAPSPISLSWRRGGRFPVVMEDSEEVEREGIISPPFGIFRGNGGGGQVWEGSKAYSLVYIPERRILASFRFVGKARKLAAELAPTLLHGHPPPGPAEEGRR